jgi:hypothetical protein
MSIFAYDERPGTPFMISEIFPLELVQAVSDWQRGGSHNQKVKRGQRLKAVTAELPEAFRLCTDPCFRQEAVTPKPG